MRVLRFYRLLAGLSQAELGRRAGMSQPKISQIENGLRARLSDYEKLHRELSKEGVLPPDVLPTALGEDTQPDCLDP